MIKERETVFVDRTQTVLGKLNKREREREVEIKNKHQYNGVSCAQTVLGNWITTEKERKKENINTTVIITTLQTDYQTTKGIHQRNLIPIIVTIDKIKQPCGLGGFDGSTPDPGPGSTPMVPTLCPFC